MMKKSLFLLGLMFLSTQAHAVLIVGFNDPTNNQANWTTSGAVISIQNISNFDARITSFGFDTTSTVGSLVSVTGTLNNGSWVFAASETVGGGGGGTFDYGAKTGANLVGGDPLSAIAVGSTGIFTFDVALNDVSNYFVRFQRTGSDGEGSDRGVLCTVDCDPPVDVPEPGTLGLLVLGLLGLGLARRFRLA